MITYLRRSNSISTHAVIASAGTVLCFSEKAESIQEFTAFLTLQQLQWARLDPELLV